MTTWDIVIACILAVMSTAQVAHIVVGLCLYRRTNRLEACIARLEATKTKLRLPAWNLPPDPVRRN